MSRVRSYSTGQLPRFSEFCHVYRVATNAAHQGSQTTPRSNYVVVTYLAAIWGGCCVAFLPRARWNRSTRLWLVNVPESRVFTHLTLTLAPPRHRHCR